MDAVQVIVMAKIQFEYCRSSKQHILAFSVNHDSDARLNA